MDSTHYETRNLLRVLTQKLLESDAAFTGQGRRSNKTAANLLFIDFH